MSRRSQPEASITRVTVIPRSGQVLLRVTCPHCTADHIHGGGTDITRAHRFLGHRVADCARPSGYVLTDPNGKIPTKGKSE